MIKGVLKLGTLATFLTALSTAPSPTPAGLCGRRRRGSSFCCLPGLPASLAVGLPEAVRD